MDHLYSGLRSSDAGVQLAISHICLQLFSNTDCDMPNGSHVKQIALDTLQALYKSDQTDVLLNLIGMLV